VPFVVLKHPIAGGTEGGATIPRASRWPTLLQRFRSRFIDASNRAPQELSALFGFYRMDRARHGVTNDELAVLHLASVNKAALKFGVMISSVALTAGLAGLWLAATYGEDDSQAILLPDQVITVLPDPKPLAAFALADDKNQIFDLARLKGRWSFVFFGFTHCPDVCPTTLAVLARAHASIAKSTVGAKDVQFVFVSVDPNRDTASTLKQYVRYFDTSFLGVTGDDAQIAKLAGQLDAKYQVMITPGVDNYPVYHTTAVFLVDPRARYRAMFTPPHDAEAISRRFEVVRQLDAGSAS